jgi:regulator of sigma E protease
MANFLMAAIIFAFVSTMNGVMSTEPVIGNVAKIPGQDFTLMVGDRILDVEEQPVQTFSQIYEIIATLERQSDIKLRIVRDGQVLYETIPHLFQPIVFHVEMFSPAMKSGLKAGDVFLEADKQVISSFEELKAVINSSKGNSVSVKIWRNGKIVPIDLTPEMRPTETSDGNLVEEMRIGVRGGTLFSPELVRPTVLEATQMGIRMTFYVVKTSLLGLVRMIDNTISPKHLSGPIGVAKALSYSATEGVMPFLSLLAAISAGIGLINLFPIPILDGGHLMLFLYEGVFTKPPSKQVIKLLMAMGLATLLALMVFATFNDIVR